MKLTESIRISWRAITGHKLRSTLTTLGVIIGIGAVICLMVLGGAFEADILQDVDQDQKIITVQTQEDSGGFGFRFSQASIYTQDDVEAVQQIEGVEYVAPDARIDARQLSHEDQQLFEFVLQATTPSRLTDSNWELVEGEAFTAKNETVVNEALTEQLDSDIEVGDEITIRFDNKPNRNFTVVGIVNDDVDGFTLPGLYVPLENYNGTIQMPSGEEKRAYPSLVVGAESLEQLEPTRDRIDAYFQNESDARKLKQEQQTIEVQTFSDLVDQFTSVIEELALFIGGIAAISLVVGSIGIANIMIVSVTERTREIGIMKAVGARKRDIMQLFLIESLILGIIGAVLGVVAGLGFGYLIAVVIIGWPMVYPLKWVAIAVGVGILVGVLSGLYPAWRAARVDPIEALRRE